MLWAVMIAVVAANAALALAPAGWLDLVSVRAAKLGVVTAISFQLAAGLYTIFWLVPYFHRMEKKTDAGLARSAQIGGLLEEVKSQIAPIIDNVRTVSRDVTVMIEDDVKPTLVKVSDFAKRADFDKIEAELRRAAGAIEVIGEKFKHAGDPPKDLPPLRETTQGLTHADRGARQSV
jgi:hypothetical protein